MNEFETRLKALIQKLELLILASDMNEIKDLASVHGEYGIALENLCAFLEDEIIVIDSADFQEILKLAPRQISGQPESMI